MENNLVNSVVTVLTAIIGVAIIAVLVGSNAKTSQVIQAGAQGFAQDLGVAVSPVTGGSGFGGIGGASFTGGGVGTIQNL
jgi:hypothetical protein